MSTPAPFQKLRAFYTRLMPGLTDESWALCESMLRVRTIRKGEFLVREGQVCHSVSFINYGLLRMYHIADGKERITEFFKEDMYTSDYRSFLLRAPSLTSIKAIEDTEVIDTSYDDLQVLYKKVPEANILGRLVAEELFIDICKRTVVQASDDIYMRYNELMAEKPWLVQRVPQYMIASFLGITPEALSRVKARASRRHPGAELVY